MPIDWGSVHWVYVGVLAVLAFIAALVGNLLSFNNRGVAAALSAILFAALFVVWSYYPHGLPLPTDRQLQRPDAASRDAPLIPTRRP